MVAARATWTRSAPLRVSSTRVFVPASTVLTRPVPALKCAESRGSSAAAADRIDTPPRPGMTAPPSSRTAAGALLVRDPVSLPLPPLGDLAISVPLPGDLPASFGITGRYSRQTNYISPPGDFTAAVAMPVGKLTDDWYFVCGVDVLASPDTGGIVALGDSLTDANISTIDAFCRWPDQLSRRLQARSAGRPMGVLNQGLGGNRILHDIRGDSGLRRFDRDVLVQPGVTHAIVMLGTNDLRNRWAKPEEEVTAEEMIAGLKQLAVRAQTRGIKIFGATLTPFENETV